MARRNPLTSGADKKMQTSLTTEFTDVALLKGMRNVLGVSQEGFACLIGMKRQQVSGYECQHHSPSISTVQEMASKAGLRLRVIIDTGDGGPEFDRR